MNKLMIFGDSVLKGVMYSPERERYVLSHDNTLYELEDYGISVKNNSLMGATVGKGLSIMEKRLSECEEGTTVLIEYGGNDCDYPWAEVSASPDEKHSPYTKEDEFIKTYTKAVELARSRGADVIMATLVPIDAEKYMNWISRGNSRENILKWLGDVSMLSRWQERYNRMVERLALRLGCPLIDLRDAFLRSHNYAGLMCEDGIHPSEEGHRIINRTILKYMLDVSEIIPRQVTIQ